MPISQDSNSVDRRLVCHCKMVTESTIRFAVAEGASSVRDIAIRTGACTGCGRCDMRVDGLLDRLLRAVRS